MVRLPVWLGLLGTSLLFASCSSDDANKTPTLLAAGNGGESGGAAPDDGGSAPRGGTVNANAGSEAAGQGSGGEGTSTLTDGWLSGTRLRAVLDVAADAKLFKRWHDVKLNVDCAFAPAADGVERCMPAVERGYAVYSDAKCTKAVALFGAGDAIPPYIAEPHRSFGCGKGAAYLEVGAAAAGVTSFYVFSNENCVENGMVGATKIVKQLGAVVPATTFVAVTKTVREARDSRLAANVLVAEDGSRQVASDFDLQREVDCNPLLRTATEGYACVPQNLAFIEVYFSDDKCKVPAAYHPPCHGEPAIILDASPQNGGQYFEVGAKVATPEFEGYSVTCGPITSMREAGAGFYAIGKEAPWSSFPQLSSKDEGKGRIAITVVRGETDELVAQQNFFDTDLNVNCSPGEAADLKTRCLPRVGGASVNVYADAKCSSGLYEIKAGDPLPDGLNLMTANAPGGGTAVFKIGAKVTSPAEAWQLSGLTCQLYSVSGAADYYSTTSIPPASLALVTREVE